MSRALVAVLRRIVVVGALCLVAVDASAFTISPPSRAFGNVVINTTSTPPLTITITNNDPATLTFNTTVNGNYAATNACGSVVPVGGTCVVSITFTPTALGPRPGSIVFTDVSNAANTRTATLTGNGVAATTATPGTLAFSGVVGGTSRTLTFTLTNNQAVPLTNINFTSPNPDYTVTGCPSPLAARTACTASVRFAPTAPPGTSENTTLTITHSAVTSGQTVNLTGQSVAPLTFAPTAVAFPPTAGGFSAAPRNVTITNNLFVPVTSLTLSTTGSFSVPQCALPLQARSSCTIPVTFSPLPTQTGTATGVLRAISSDPAAWNQPLASLSGPVLPPIQLTPALVAYGSVTVASTSAGRVITIRNNTNTTVTLGSPSFGGANPGDFSQSSTTCGASLAPSTSCTATVTFRPTQGGARSARFLVNDSAPGSPHGTNLTGTGTTPLTISPPGVSFGGVNVGLVSTGRLVTVTNNQSVPVTFTALTVTGDFVKQDTATTQTTCGTVLAAGASCTVSVVLQPRIGGARTGQVSFVSNASTSPNVVTLSGTGTNSVTSSAPAIVFGSQRVGTTSISRQVTLTNHQTVSVSVNAAVTGDFAITNACGGLIPALSTCAVSATFSPTATGTRSGTLTYNRPGSTAGLVSLNGSGTTVDPPAAVQNVAPGAGTVAALVPGVVITGNGYTHFAAGSTVSFGAGIAVANPRNISANSITVDLTLAGNAVPGARTVTVSTPLSGGGTENASLASGFIVSASPALSFTSVSPQSGRQGETLNVSIVGSNTHFQQGVTLANFGDGVMVNGPVSVQDSTHAVANVTVSPTAYLGWRTVTLVTGGEYATLTPTSVNGPGFLVTASTATLSSVVPATGVQGETPFPVTVTGSGTHFVQNASNVSFGAGINVGSVTVVSPTQLTATVAVTAGATPGPRDVSVVTGGESATLVTGFTVIPSETIPYLSTVVPSTGRQGQTLSLTLTGVNTHFTSDSPSPTLTLGSNITVDSLNVVSDTTITADVSIALIANVGSRTATLSSGGTDFNFTLVVTPSNATLLSIAPPSAPEGTALTLTILAQDTHWAQGITTAWFVDQVVCPEPEVTRVTITSATSAELDVTIPDNACLGGQTLQIATGGEVLTGTFNVFDQTPSLTMSPATGLIGTSLTVNFIGEFSHFADSMSPAPTTAVIDGAGVEIQNFTVLSPTSATARFVIAPDAIPGRCLPNRDAGCHLVTLTTPLGSGAFEILTTDFIVTSTPAGLTSILPFHMAPGTTGTIRILGAYTHFTANQTTVTFGPNISAATPVVVSPTELMVNVVVDSVAALGWRSAYVNTGNEQLTIGFRVDGPATPSIVSVTPASGAQGQSLTVSITGANTSFNASSELILGAGVTVSQFTVTSPTTATANVAISPTAPIGPNAVVVLTQVAAQQVAASGVGFSVVPGASQILSVTPNAVTQNQTLYISVVGQGTHWLQGATTASFGSGVHVDQLAIQDATHATAQVTVLSTAALGFQPVSFLTDGEYVTTSQGLNVQQGTPALISSSPNAGQQNTTSNVQVLGRFTHWQQDVTTASYGYGVIVNSFTVIDSVSAVANVTIDPLSYLDIPPACHNLIVTTGTEQVFLANQLCVQAGAAAVTGVNPGTSPQGSTLTVTVTGHNTHFVAGLTTADFGPGINVSNVTVTSPTTASVAIAVTTQATNGFHTVTMRTLGETATLAYGFVVDPNTPTLNSAVPNSGQRGQSLTVRVLGQYTHWLQGVTTVTFGQGITVDTTSIVDSTTADVSIQIGAGAVLGARSVTVTTGGEIVSGNVFSVTAGGGIISDVAPDSGNQGQTVLLTISGNNTNWAQGLTQFSISGAGGDIRVNYVLVDSPTSATASITISPTAALGARSVYMSTGPEALVDTYAFVVTGGIPAIASLNPGSAPQGASALNVEIAGLYTEWLTGTTTVDFGPGITLAGFTVNNDTSITAVIDVAVAAALGNRVVTVRNGTQVLTAAFPVVSNQPPAPAIPYLSPWSALRGQTLTVSISGQYTHWNPATSTIDFGDPGTNGITINSFQVTSQTSALVNITIAPDAGTGPRTLGISTGTELVQATFSVVDEPTAISIVDPASGMQGGSAVLNVIGQYTAWDSSTTFDFGSGVTVNSVTVLGPTIAQVAVSVDQLALLGLRQVSATTNGETVYTLVTTGFAVTPSQALITAVSPNTAKQQDLVTVAVTGQNTHWNSGTAFSLGSGISITSQTVTDPTHATLTLSIDALAGIGAYSITATTGGEIASMTNAFVVQPGTPLILSSGPPSAQQQQMLNVTILGQFTEWENDTTFVDLGNGVTVSPVNVTSPTSITVGASVEWWGATGYRTITVTKGSQVLTLPNGLLVTAGPAAIAQLTPPESGQGTSLNVIVTGVNTHFQQGVTTASFGPGITVNSVDVQTPTSATVNASVAANSTPGYNTVSLTTLGESAVAVSAFLIQATTPSLQFVSPSSAAQGSTETLTVTGSLTNFDSTTVFDFGPDVTVNSTSIVSAVQANVNVTVSPLAYQTVRDVTATTNAVTALGTGLFAVTAGPAYISAVTPSSGRQNQVGLQVTISGNGTHFTAAAPTVSLGAGVTVTAVQVVSDTNLIATVNISPSAPVQSNQVSVTTLGEIALLPAGFAVTAGNPIILSAFPSTAHQNDTLTVTVNGQYTNFAQGVTALSFGSGIQVNSGSIQVQSNTQLTVEISVDPAASPGSRTVTVTSGSEVATGVGVVTVLAGVPQIQSVTPNTGGQGSTQTLTISALYTSFQAGVSQVSFSGNGVTVGTVTVNGPTQIQVPVTVTSGATAGGRTVTVTTGSESVSLTNGFTVLAGLPAITVISPNVAVPDSVVSVQITGQFTNFVNGVTQARFGPGISVNGAAPNTFGTIDVTGATAATATLTIDAGATLSARDVSVQTGTEVLNVPSGFTVQSSTPTAPAVLAFSPVYGTTGVPINSEITVQFTAPIDRTTINSGNFRVVDSRVAPCWYGYGGISGSVTVDASGRIATFTPTAVLAVGRAYTACVNYGNPGGVSSILDPSGNGVSAAATGFTTGFAPDTTGAAFTNASIADGDTTVPTNAPVLLGFSKSINPITVAQGLTITSGGSPVPGTFGYSQTYREITFTPSSSLMPNTSYVVSYSALLEDIAGNPLANPGSFTFTTGSAADFSGPSIVTYSPASGATAGVNTAVRVAFSEPLMAQRVDTTNIYLYDATTGGVVQGATVSLSADRKVVTLTPPAALNPGAIYVWNFSVYDRLGYGGNASTHFFTSADADTTAPSIVAVSPMPMATVPVNARIQAITSEPIDRTVPISVSLTPATTVTYTLASDNVTLTVTPAAPLAANTTYVVTISGIRDTSGNVMAPYGWSFTTDAAGASDTSNGTITGLPTSGSTNVPAGTPVVLSLSEPVSGVSVHSQSVAVYDSTAGQYVAGTLSLSPDARTITFTPTFGYSGGHSICVYASYFAALVDLAGNPFNYVAYCFTVATAADATPPQVLSVTPFDGATGIGPRNPVKVTFSEPVLSSTVTGNVALYRGSTLETTGVAVANDGQTVTFGTGSLQYGVTYTVVVAPYVRDLAGNALPAQFTSTFTIAPRPVTTRPEVRLFRPTGTVSSAARPTFFLSQSIDPSTLAGALYVSQNGVLITGTVTTSANNQVVMFTPSVPLQLGSLVEVWLTSAATDQYRNRVYDYQNSFMVTPDLTATTATLLSYTPSSSSVNPVNTVIRVVFNKPINPATVDGNSFFLRDCANNPVPASIALLNGNKVMQLTPSSPLASNSCASYHVTAAVQDVNGVPVGAFGIGFYTNSSSDAVAPSVIDASPVNGATSIGVNATIRLTFSERIDMATVTTSSIALTSGGNPIPRTDTSFINADGTLTVTLTPDRALPENAQVTVAVNGGVTDFAGNPASAFSATYTTAGQPDFSHPAVVNSTVANGATNVPVTSVITLTFDRPMDTRTFIYSSTIYLRDLQYGYYAWVPATMSFSADRRQVTIAPTSPLAVNRPYQMVVSSVLDLTGNAADTFTANFTTTLFPSAGGPVVQRTLPYNGAAGVPVNVQPSVQFDRSVSRPSFSSVTLLANGTPAPFTAAFTNGDTTATLSPSSLLQPNTTYLWTIGGVTDTAGNPMGASTVVQFTTGATIDVTPPAIVSTTPMSGALTGTNPTIRILLNEPIDPLRATGGYLFNNGLGLYVSATTFTPSADWKSFTLTYPTPLEPNTVYSVCWPVFYDLGGNALGGPCFNFTTGSVADTSPLSVIDVTPPAGAAGVPINSRIAVRFNKAVDPTSLPASPISLTPAAAGTVSLSSDRLTLTYQLTGTLAANTSYSLAVNGLNDLNGNPLTPFLSSFSTAGVSDAAGGAISLTSPAYGSTGVPVDTAITVTLSEPVNPLSLTADAFVVYANSIRVAGSLSIGGGGTTLTFTPHSPLPPNAPIVIYVGYFAGLLDLAGNGFGYLALNAFTTGATADTSGPQIISMSPPDSTTGVGRYTTVTLVFSESIDPSTITTTNFALYNGYTYLGSATSYSSDNRIVTLSAGALPADRTITVVVDTGVRDVAGNTMATPFRGTFTTRSGGLSTPAITTTRPVSGSVEVPLESVITLYANNMFDPSSLAGAVAVAQNGVLVNGNVAVTSGGRALVFTPAAPFAYGATVQLFLTNAARDTNGASFGQFAMAFTTTPDPNTAPLQVTSAYPGNGAPTNAFAQVRFNKNIDPGYADLSHFYMTGPSGSIAGSVSLERPNVIRFTPAAPLAPNTYPYCYFTSSLRFVDGTTTSNGWCFSTGAGQDTLAPAVTGITPANGASAIGDNTATRVRFNKLMDETSLNGSTITLQSGGNTLPFSLLFSGASGVTTVTLTPQAPLPDNAMITLSLGAGINDLVGQPIAAQSVSFTTANGPDVTAPVIVASNPTGAEVPVNVTTFTWRFSEPLDPLTVGGTFDYVQLYPSGAVLPSTVVLSPDGRTITLTLAGNLSPSTYYYACSVGAADLTGNVSGAGCTTIRTSSASSVTPPQVIGHNPVTGATNVAINSQIDVVFDVPVSTTSFDQITVTAGGSPVPFSVALHPYYAQLSGRAIQLIPLSLLNANTTYTVDISGVRDYAGNVMSGHYTFSFSTGVDLASPTSFSTLTARVSGVPTQLINNVYVNGVSTTTTLEALFSAPIDVASIMNGGVRLYVVGAGTLVPLTVTMSADGRTAIVTPQSPLAAGTAYRATVNYDVAVYDQALAGVSGSGGFFNFTTAP